MNRLPACRNGIPSLLRGNGHRAVDDEQRHSHIHIHTHKHTQTQTHTLSLRAKPQRGHGVDRFPGLGGLGDDAALAFPALSIIVISSLSIRNSCPLGQEGADAREACLWDFCSRRSLLFGMFFRC
jgi:hypothetical protein